MQETVDRRQRTEVRRHNADDRKRSTEDRSMIKREIWALKARQSQSAKAFMQNKANLCKGKMNASSIRTKDYEN